MNPYDLVISPTQYDRVTQLLGANIKGYYIYPNGNLTISISWTFEFATDFFEE